MYVGETRDIIGTGQERTFSILPKTLFERSLIEKVQEINNVDRI